MLILDDILLAPIRGLFALARQVAAAVEQEREGEEEAIKAELRELYMRLETGQISEEDFDAREAELLDQLDALAAVSGEDEVAFDGGEAAEATEDEDHSEDDEDDEDDDDARDDDEGNGDAER